MLSVGNLVQKAWFHIYDIQGEAKALGQEIVYWSPRTGCRKKDLLARGMRVLSGITEMVYILIAVVIQLCCYTTVYICQKSLSSCTLKRSVFIVHKLYLNKTELNWPLRGEKAKPKKITSLPFIILCKLFKLSWPHLLICITDTLILQNSLR